jgi:hypothetical protein
MSLTKKPSDEIDTIAYSVSYLQAAKILAERGIEDNGSLIVPFYALIGFSLENGLKAVLEFLKVEPRSDWFYSHDLTALRKCVEAKAEVEFSDVAAEFIDHLSTPHREHHFRYPQKATQMALNKPPAAIEMTERLLISIFEAINGPSRVEGAASG